ncbi:UNVERIFIED_CONTAM: hypothetical protein FKN15_075724 [Acipenser sinensis]
MDDRMREVYNYLSDNNYPPSYSMLQKLTLRRYASNLPFKFAEQYLTSGSIDQVETSPASIRAERLEIAGLLMENQVHTYQYMGYCELDDNGSRHAYSSHAYDGKDFISLDVETLTWTAAVPQAVFYKHKREADAAWQQITFNYYRQVCFQLLEWCLQCGMETLQRKVGGTQGNQDILGGPGQGH